MKMHISHEYQRGSALVYILIAIALLAALTATLMNSSSNTQTTAQRTAETYGALKSQIDLIRSAITECIQTYPSGDNALAANPALSSVGYTSPYPLSPYDTYLAGYVSGPSYARNIRCPGNPGNSNNHVKIFGGTSGKYLRPAPQPWSDWLYFSVPQGIYIMTWTSSTDAHLLPTIQKLDAQYSKCEADVINARSGVKALDSSGNNCPSGAICLRVWVLPTGTSSYPDEAGCPAP